MASELPEELKNIIYGYIANNSLKELCDQISLNFMGLCKYLQIHNSILYIREGHKLEIYRLKSPRNDFNFPTEIKNLFSDNCQVTMSWTGSKPYLNGYAFFYSYYLNNRLLPCTLTYFDPGDLTINTFMSEEPPLIYFDGHNWHRWLDCNFIDYLF